MNISQFLEADADGVLLPVSREAAAEAGYRRYFTGVPCMRGHKAERHVANTRCVQCHREKAAQLRLNDPATKEKAKQKARAAEAGAASLGRKLVSRVEARQAGLTRFFTGLPCAQGHVVERLSCDYSCVECSRQRAAAERAKNPEISRRRVRKSYQRNIEVNRTVAREYMRSKVKADPEAFRVKQRERQLNDPLYAFKHRARQMVRTSFLRTGFRKAAKTEALLGCTLDEFRAHIERQFLPNMGWHNMHLWEIDHIVPMSTATNQEEAEVLNRLTNLRPLWRIDNRTKHAKRTHLL